VLPKINSWTSFFPTTKLRTFKGGNLRFLFRPIQAFQIEKTLIGGTWELSLEMLIDRQYKKDLMRLISNEEVAWEWLPQEQPWASTRRITWAINRTRYINKRFNMVIKILMMTSNVRLFIVKPWTHLKRLSLGTTTKTTDSRNKRSTPSVLIPQ
jgi:hypothetical protein